MNRNILKAFLLFFLAAMVLIGCAATTVPEEALPSEEAGNGSADNGQQFLMKLEKKEEMILELDLTEISDDELTALLGTIDDKTAIRAVNLGSDKGYKAETWKKIRKLQKNLPDAEIHYTVTLYGVPIRLEDEEVDISYKKVGNQWPQVLEIAKCMPNLKLLMMDSCGVKNADMAKIRDALPNAEVVWRINFGLSYTARTNETRILASKPSMGGNLSNGDVAKFKYFTKMKYLDIGHNETITDLSFVRYMPDLEVLIVAMNPLVDLRPLADCENLEYLELFYTRIKDLSPLAGLKNLRHLNVGHCPFLKDISPIYGLELDRFYLGAYASCPVPEKQVDHYRQLHPNCEVENRYYESSEGAWRRSANLKGAELEWYKQQPYYKESRKSFAPRYALLRDQMGYDKLLYSTRWNDPTYKRVDWEIK